MRVHFLLAEVGRLYPKLYPIGRQRRRLAIHHYPFAGRFEMAGLKLRGSIFYLTYYANNKKRVVSLDTDSLQLAKEKKRQFESARARGGASSLPTRTPCR